MANEINPVRLAITNSLIKRFRRSIIWLYVATIAVIIPIIYFVTHHQAYNEANKELSLLVDMVNSVREYIAEDVRPDLLQANMFQSPAISGVTTTNKVGSRFSKKRPDYYIKFASDNPLNRDNLPEPLENKLLIQYRADKNLKGITEIGEIKGSQFLVASRPSVANQECMVCHGDPRKAPLPIISKYGMNSGYNYKLGDTVGTSLVGVPLADINALVMQRGLVAMGIITLVFSLIFIIINTLVKKSILLPITQITEAAIVLSKGDLEREINIKQDGSEIGELAHSFELLRRSLKWAMENSQQ